MSASPTDRAGSVTPPGGYGGVMRAIHWTTPVLLIAVYTLAWSIDGAGSRDEAMWLTMMHRSFGLTILALTLFRLVWRQISHIPALPESLPRLQRIAARLVTAALYLLLLLQPLLGLTASEAHGDRIRVFDAFTVPLLMATNRPVSRQIFAVHGMVALVILAVVGLHACAALYHHFVLRDEVLRGMLPSLRPLSRRRDPTAA